MNFWKKLKGPVVGLAPMDGVTDAAFRRIVCKYSSPSFVVTEFTNVEGLARGATKMLKAFIYGEGERPVVGQLFGVEVDSFYKCSVMLCEMGFDGIDINMGCPMNKIAKKGSGAGLIRTPELAVRVVEAVKRGVKDWSEGMGMSDAGFSAEMVSAVKKKRRDRCLLPVSVKTRIGYDKVVVDEWIKVLVEAGVDVVCVHGRTLKQLYLGEADWEAIGRAAEICHGSGVMCLGNGDVKSMEDAVEKIGRYGVDGVMVGRAVMGNPWFFGEKSGEVGGGVGRKERVKVALEHARLFDKLSYAPFHAIRKHLAWYMHGFEGAKDLRMELMKVSSIEDVEKIVKL